MGIFDSFIDLISAGIQCPSCGTPGAKKSDGRIYCLNPVCVYFDPHRGAHTSAAPPPKRDSARPDPWAKPDLPRSSATSPLVIQYLNFRKEAKTFRVEPNSVRRKNNHILAREKSSGQQITLCRDRIQNMPEVDPLLPEKDRTGAPRPTARELQVLGYHKKYRSTSPLHQRIKAKYPDW